MNNLDAEEQEILEAFERGELKRAPNLAQELERHREIAAATFKKDSRINIRISSRDLRALSALLTQEHLEGEARQGQREDFERVLKAVPDVEPEDYDRL